MVGPNGLEPSTSSVSGRRSNQLSYGPAFIFKHLQHKPPGMAPREADKDFTTRS